MLELTQRFTVIRKVIKTKDQTFKCNDELEFKVVTHFFFKNRASRFLKF